LPTFPAQYAVFWVWWMNGAVKQQQVKWEGFIRLVLSFENDRFLTLVETDGGDPEGRLLTVRS
jgi:hypothetical protein